MHTHQTYNQLRKRILILFLSSFSLILGNFIPTIGCPIEGSAWMTGSAQVDITPEGSLWMAGYASRTKPTNVKMHSLWAKALVVKDQQENIGVFISADLVGIPKHLSDRMRDKINDKFGLSKNQIIINSSHTHSGPYMFDPFRPSSYTMPEKEIEKVKLYNEVLVNKIIALVGDAMENLAPSQIYSGEGTARFQVNRRNNTESTLWQQSDLNGPNDYAVPVLKVEDESGNVKTVLFGYACHATVLSGYEWSGDYPGFAQLELQKEFPDATVMFFQGCGGDQNPLPRRKESLALQYGKTLAASVVQALQEDMIHLEPKLTTAYKEIDLKLSNPPSMSELKEFRTQNENKYFDTWADFMIEKLDRGESLIESYPYPVQIWNLGDQKIVGLGGETVIEYSIRIKEILGRNTFVFGYSNDANCAYIPSSRILEEGGYEGKTSQYHKGFPSVWESSVELDILNAVTQLARENNIPLIQRSLAK